MTERPRSTRPVNPWVASTRLMDTHRWAMVGLAVTSFAGAMLEALFLVGITGVVVALTRGADQLGPVAGVTIPISLAIPLGAVALAIRLALATLTVRQSAALAAAVRTRQRQRLAHAYLAADWETQHAEPAGKLQELLTTFVGQVNAAVSSVTSAVTASLSLAAFLGAGFFIAPLATLAVLAALGVLGSLLMPLRRRIRRSGGQLASVSLEFVNATAELGSLGLEMQTMGVRQRFTQRINRLIGRTTQEQHKVQVLTGMLAPVYTTLAYGAVLICVGLLRITDVSALPALSAVMLLMLRSLSYAQQLSATGGALAGTLPFVERLEFTVAHYEDHRQRSGTRVPVKVAPIEVLDVDFAYSDDRAALRDLTFSITEGELIGVIGPSGAGKSTLAELLMGLRSPSSGRIRTGGEDLREIDRAWWTSRVAYVPQEARLLTGTVSENIRFFRDGLSDAAVTTASDQANLLGDIRKLPDGFETHLGESGRNLSGGQRQRLSIARALVTCPDFILMDEPTSSLDSESEALIRQTVASIHGSVTIVIIAHRMSTLDLCDRILVLEGGEMTALDTPASLRENSPFYRKALGLIETPSASAS